MNVGYRHFLAPDDFFRSAALLLEGYRAENLSDGSLNNQNVGLRLTSFTNTNDSYWTRYLRYKETLPVDFAIYRAAGRATTHSRSASSARKDSTGRTSMAPSVSRRVPP